LAGDAPVAWRLPSKVIDSHDTASGRPGTPDAEAPDGAPCPLRAAGDPSAAGPG
jgi:hypothetical protein